jgi:hypothetical protein
VRADRPLEGFDHSLHPVPRLLVAWMSFLYGTHLVCEK